MQDPGALPSDPPRATPSNGEATPPPETPRPARSWLRLGLLALLLGGAVAFLTLGGADLLSFETLGRHHEALKAWVGAHPVAAGGAFFVVYVLSVTFSLPGAVWISIAGGYLFGPVAGPALIVAAATIGATAVFLAARFILGDQWRRRLSGTLARLEAGFRDNAFSSLLVLRLVPLFPFWLVNLAPAFLGMRTAPYIAATALGIIPGAVVFSSLGNGLGAVLEAGGTPDLTLMYDPEILLPLLGLAALAAIPAVYRARRGRRQP
jgi:uncharacterized membrane protein YdjX (TVP38/TMEM64 family)